MALKVFDLQCEHGHQFEGWFGSHEEYDQQKASAMLVCPFCESPRVERIPSAPRLNVGSTSDRTPKPKDAQQGGAVQARQLQAAMLQRLREVVQSAEDVGVRFAQEAKRMHEGQSTQRAIRGTATREERQELREEGIAVFEVPSFLDDERLN